MPKFRFIVTLNESSPQNARSAMAFIRGSKAGLESEPLSEDEWAAHQGFKNKRGTLPPPKMLIREMVGDGIFLNDLVNTWPGHLPELSCLLVEMITDKQLCLDDRRYLTQVP